MPATNWSISPVHDGPDDGLLGDRILVNGRPDFVLPVATRPYACACSTAPTHASTSSVGGTEALDGHRHGRRSSGATDPAEPRDAGPGGTGGVVGRFRRPPSGTELRLQSLAFAGQRPVIWV